MAQNSENIDKIYIEEEMRSAYIDYSMSVIVSRALPDVRDGLKPVHRRVLYGMLDLGLRPTSAYKKSATTVGEVLGKYHPHGDRAVYDTMARMAQDFSLRYPLVDGQGNFGSIDGDPPAAMRYTEARLAKIAEEVLRDIEKDTVDFVPNFDESLQEPSVLPSMLPTLLVNGAAGIAVGMATNIPPHNLNEVIDAIAALIAKPSIKPGQLRKYIQGPDFPTGAVIMGDDEIDSYFNTGRGKLCVQARIHVEDMSAGQRKRLVVTEIPYQVNKSTMLEKIGALAREKKIEGIQEIRDESDREGMRIVFELRKEANTDKVIKDLFKHTQMQTTFGVIMLALVNGIPKILTIKEMLQHFIEFRHDVVLRRIKFDLDKAEKRAHILEGLKIALDNIDEVIEVIKKSRSTDSARTNLMKRFKLSQIQAQAILDMRLQRLTGLERKKIEDEYLALIKLIAKLKSLLASKPMRMQLVKKELLELKELYGDNRRTQIIGKPTKKSLQELMKEDETLVTVTNTGVICRHSLADPAALKEKLQSGPASEMIEQTFKTTNSHHLLFYTNLGHVFRMRSGFIPMSNGDATTMQTLLKLGKKEHVINVFNITKYDENQYLFMVTRDGMVKKASMAVFAKLKEGPNAALSLKDGDELVSIFSAPKDSELLIASAGGQAIRFAGSDLRDDMGITAGGVKGITLEDKDVVIGMIAVTDPKAMLLSVTTLGYGKKSLLREYSMIGRGGKGIKNYSISEKTGNVASVALVEDKQTAVLLTQKGRIKRQKVKQIKLAGRATQGAPVTNLAQKDEISRIVIVSAKRQLF